MHFNLGHILQTLLLICLSVHACFGNPLTADTQANKVLSSEELTPERANKPVNVVENPMAVAPAAAQAQCVEDHGYCASAAQCCSKRCLTYAAKCMPSTALGVAKDGPIDLETLMEK